MLIYHGTTWKRGKQIEHEGSIHPRGYLGTQGNYIAGATSHPECVYLAREAAACHAWCAALSVGERDGLALVQVDLDRLNHAAMLPDEDYLMVYCLHQKGIAPASLSKSDKDAALSCCREMMTQYPKLWDLSLIHGGAAHRGSIPREAITGIAYVRLSELQAHGINPLNRNPGYQHAITRSLFHRSAAALSPFAPINYPALWGRALATFCLSHNSPHGCFHWIGVEESGLALIEQSAKPVDRDVVRLFAALHDVCRHDDNHDPQHGPRAAVLARQWRGEFFTLDDDRFERLHYAIARHTDGMTSDDPAIGACWDADRLQLPRVGIYPEPQYMSTEAGKQQAQELQAKRNDIEYLQRHLQKTAAPMGAR